MDLSREELHELFEYDPESRTGLVSKSTGISVGYQSRASTWYVNIGRKKYNLARVSYQLVYGDIKQLDGVFLKDKNKPPLLTNLFKVSERDVKKTVKAKNNMLWSDLFYYKQGILYWKIDNCKIVRGSSHFLNFAHTPVNASTNSEGYKRIDLKTDCGVKSHSYARIIWQVLRGEIPEGMVIDHIDGNRTNNFISNLRLVTRYGNMRNQGLAKNNTSGVIGVHYSKDGYWTARHVDAEGVRRTKKFSVDKLGYQEAFEEAVKYRKSKLEDVNKHLGKEGYTKRHINSEEVL